MWKLLLNVSLQKDNTNSRSQRGAAIPYSTTLGLLKLGTGIRYIQALRFVACIISS